MLRKVRGMDLIQLGMIMTRNANWSFGEDGYPNDQGPVCF